MLVRSLVPKHLPSSVCVTVPCVSSYTGCFVPRVAYPSITSEVCRVRGYTSVSSRGSSPDATTTKNATPAPSLNQEYAHTEDKKPSVRQLVYNALKSVYKRITEGNRDPFVHLSSILIVARSMQSNKASTPPTSADFPFQAQDRQAPMEEIFNKVIKGNFQAFNDKLFKNKKLWGTSLWYGLSGVGKTRFSLELLDILRDTQMSGKTEELQSLLEDSHTVLINIRHNGSRLSKEELEWDPSIILGLRFAAECWCPGVDYRSIRDLASGWSSHQLSMFHLSAVIDHFAKHPPAGRSSVPKMVHLVVDEIQTAFHLSVLRDSKSESLAKAFNRVLANTTSSNTPVFTIASLVGTAQRNKLTLLLPTDPFSIYVCIRPLSVESSRRIVRSFKNGDAWVAKNNFDLVLAACGGNTRTLEPLKELLDAYDEPPVTVPLQSLLDHLVEKVGTLFNAGSWDGVELGLYLALAGIPVTKDLVLNPGAANQVTVADLEEDGCVQLRAASNAAAWRKSWPVQLATQDFVMEVPLVVALAALGASQGNSSGVVSNATDRLALKLLAPCYSSATSFEHFSTLHQCFRYNVAVDLARMQKRDFIPAKHLFYGMVCSPQIRSMRFKPEHVVLHEPPVAGVWLQVSNLTTDGFEVPTKINLQDGSDVEIFGEKSHAIMLGGTNVVDAIVNGVLVQQGKESTFLIIYDTKLTAASLHGTLDFKSDIRPLIAKRRHLEQKLRVPVILAVLSNRALPHAASELLGDDAKDGRTCILSRSSEGIEFGVSPTFAPFLYTEIISNRKE